MKTEECQHDWVYEPYTVSSVIRKICRKCFKEECEMLKPLAETTVWDSMWGFTTLSEFDELMAKKRGEKNEYKENR